MKFHAKYFSSYLKCFFKINHSIYLYLKWYPTSWLPLHKPPPHPTYALFPHPFLSIRVYPHPPTLSFPAAPASPMLGHQTLTGPKATPPIDVRQGHPLLPMYVEPWIPPCTLLGWWSGPWEHWLVQPAYVILPMGLQSLSTPPVLLPALRIPHWDPELSLMVGSKHPHLHCSVASRTSQEIATPGSCYQTPLGNSNSVWVWCLQTKWIPSWVGLQMALPSVSAPFFVPVFPLDRNIPGLKTLWWVGGLIPQSGDKPIYWRCYLQVLSPLYYAFLLKSSLLGPGSLSLPWCQGHSSGYPQFLIPHCYIFLFNSWPSVPLSCSL
jgi:hypothetical protein